MKWYCGLLACAIVSLAAGDYDCFKNSVSQCENRFYLKHGFKQFPFCKIRPYIMQCQVNAAIKCKTGFESTAREARDEINSLCIKGTNVFYEEILKEDPNCGTETLDSGKCLDGLNEELTKLPNKDDDIERSRIRCKWFDDIKNCMYKKFRSQCTEDAQIMFMEITDAVLKLEKSICKLLPAA